MTYEQKTLKYKIIAWLYFPVQYLVARWLTIGTALSPTIGDIVTGFNIAGIMQVVDELVLSVGSVLSVEHIAFLIVNLLPYAVRLAVNALPIAIFCYAAYTLIIFCTAQLSLLLHNRNIDVNNVVSVRIGQPGSGKSSSAGYDAVITARKMWAELQYKYMLMRQHISENITVGAVDKVLEWYEVRDSYDYWMTSDCVPCLFANIPLMVKGQNVSVLTYEHAAQIKKLPYHAVLYFDEVGSVFRTEMSTDKPLVVSDFFRLSRHFGDYRIICTEQDKLNIFIDVRRVVAENRYMLRQRWVNRPWLFILPYKLIRLLVRYTKGSRALSRVAMTANTIVKHIGQREYKYINQQNTELSYKKKERIKTIYLPTMLNYQYDDRTFRNLYLAKHKDINTEIFDSLLLQGNAKNKQRYLKTSKAVNWYEKDKDKPAKTA